MQEKILEDLHKQYEKDSESTSLSWLVKFVKVNASVDQAKKPNFDVV